MHSVRLRSVRFFVDPIAFDPIAVGPIAVGSKATICNVVDPILICFYYKLSVAQGAGGIWR